VEDLLRADGTVLRFGSWKKPEIRLVDLKDRPVVIKDWRGIARWMRPWARLMCRREERIYHALANVPGIPDLLAAGDAVLVLERVPGSRISNKRNATDSPQVVKRFTQVVEAMHDAGVYHADMRKRDNVLVSNDGQIGIIDFESAFIVRQRGLLGRILRPVLSLVDRYAVLKWKQILDPGGMTAKERRLVRWLDALRFRRSS
jgi:RIO-like serine/threonine protein kinase